jgi:hypothetical protein
MQTRFVRRLNAQSFPSACGHTMDLTVREAGGSVPIRGVRCYDLTFPAGTDGQREVLGMAPAARGGVL